MEDEKEFLALKEDSVVWHLKAHLPASSPFLLVLLVEIIKHPYIPV